MITIPPIRIIDLRSQSRYHLSMTPNSNDLIKKRRGPDQHLWFVVAHATDMTSASIPAGLLQTANIPVYLYREAIGSSALPLSVGKMGGVDITVPEAYYAEAIALLESDIAFDELPDPDDDTGSEKD